MNEMLTAFVLINCDLGSERELIQKLKSLTNVKEVMGTYGAYDIIVTIEESNVHDIKKTVKTVSKFNSITSIILLSAKN